MPFELIIDVARLVIVVVVVDFERVKFSGWPIYRGNAAEFSVEFNVSWNKWLKCLCLILDIRWHICRPWGARGVDWNLL